MKEYIKPIIEEENIELAVDCLLDSKDEGTKTDETGEQGTIFPSNPV